MPTPPTKATPAKKTTTKASTAKPAARKPAARKAPAKRTTAAATKKAATGTGSRAKATAKPKVDTICLGQVVGIAESADLQKQLAEYSESKKPVCIDASKVERVDTSILQLLVASSISGRFSGRPLTWSGTSEAVLESARRLGLARELGLPK